jgi:hypothetical protein
MLQMIIRRSQTAEVYLLLVMIQKLLYAGKAFTMKMNSDEKNQCGNGI